MCCARCGSIFKNVNSSQKSINFTFNENAFKSAENTWAARKLTETTPRRLTILNIRETAAINLHSFTNSLIMPCFDHYVQFLWYHCIFICYTFACSSILLSHARALAISFPNNISFRFVYLYRHWIGCCSHELLDNNNRNRFPNVIQWMMNEMDGGARKKEAKKPWRERSFHFFVLRQFKRTINENEINRVYKHGRYLVEVVHKICCFFFFVVAFVDKIKEKMKNKCSMPGGCLLAQELLLLTTIGHSEK